MERERLGERLQRQALLTSPVRQVNQAFNPPVHSTPIQRGGVCNEPVESPVRCPPGPADVYRPEVALTPTPQPVLMVPPAEDKVGTQVLTIKAVKVFKYVDDNISVEKLNFGQTPITTQDGKNVKVKLATNLQNGFRSITSKAREKGMVVNSNKTKLLTISDALNHRPSAYIMDEDNNRIESSSTMNILGFHLSDRPDVNEHVKQVVKKLRVRYWTIYHLRRVGFTTQELVQVYKTMLLPIADYCCPAYHSMMTDLQDQELERSQPTDYTTPHCST